MKTIIYFLVGAIIFTSCKKDDYTINGRVLIRETDKPLSGFILTFDVSTGDFIFGTIDDAKYSTVTDANGYFSFEIEEGDKDHYFHINDFSTGEHCWTGIDTNDVQNKYRIVSENRYIRRGVNITLLYSPRGIIDFYVPEEVLEQIGVDTVVVSSKYDTDTLIGSLRNEKHFVEPGTVHTFKFEAIKNGLVVKTTRKEILVPHQCNNELEFYPVCF